MSFYLGIDLGTSYFKAGVFDEQGNLKGLGRCAVNKETGDGSRCELPVAVFWQTLRACIDQALQNGGILPEDIAALSYSSQTNSFILLDDSGEALTPLILWTDERVKKSPTPLSELTERSDFLINTGLGIKPGIHATIAKIDWFQKEQPEVWSKARNVMSISDYFVFVLTSKRFCDYSTASMSGLFSVLNKKWWKEAIDVFNVNENQLSIPLKTGTLAGEITKKGAEYTGLSQNTQLFLGALDHHAVAIGAGLLRSNYISESTGTVLACVNYQKTYNPRKGINVAPGLDENQYFQLAFNTNGAVGLEWYKQNHAPELTIQQLLELAGKVEPHCDGLTAKACANEYPGLSGFENRTEKHTHGHYVRAILESTSLSLSELVKILDETNETDTIIPSGGGAQSELWLQIKANLLKKRFLAPESGELACKGAAMLALMGCSFPSETENIIEKWTKYKAEIHPQ